MERRIFLRSGLALGAIGALELLRPGQLMAGSCYSRLAKPSLSCLGSTGTTITLQLCAGMNGAPGGFTIEWMFSSDYVANGKSWVAAGDPKLFYAAFVPAGCKSKYSLSKLQCLPITIGGLVVGNGVSTNSPGPLVAGLRMSSELTRILTIATARVITRQPLSVRQLAIRHHRRQSNCESFA